MREEWREVVGFPLYQVSDLGRVRRHPDHRHWTSRDVLATPANGSGYPCVRLMRDQKSHWRAVHVLLCEAFHGPRPTPTHDAIVDGPVRLANVRWTTRAESFARKPARGTNREGSASPHAKLDPAKVLDIRRAIAAGETDTTIAKRYGVGSAAIFHIRSGRNWKHVQLPDATKETTP